MSEIKSKTKKLHQLAIEQVQATNDYFNSMLELERILADCRMNVSTAKWVTVPFFCNFLYETCLKIDQIFRSQNGFALSCAGFIDKRDIEPNVYVKIENEKFEIIHPIDADEISEKDELKEDEKSSIRKRGGKDSKKDDGIAEEDDGKEDSKKKVSKRKFLFSSLRFREVDSVHPSH